MFGTLSSSDLSDIRSNIGTLAKNQQTISNVLEKGLSILNITRLQVAENRQSINSIIDSLHEVDKEIDYITQELGKQIFELEQFVYLFSRLDLAVQGIKTVIQRSLYYFSHLQVQLNALSMQKLSPDTIEPKEMKQVLKDIETRLPNSYGLPSDPDKDLWTFYKLLLKPLWIKTWYQKGLRYVNDLLAENGNFYSQTDIEAKYNIKTNFVQFQGMIQAVKLYARRNDMENFTKKIEYPIIPNTIALFTELKRRQNFLYNSK